MSEFIEMIEELLPEGWEIPDPEMGLDCLLQAPCGDIIEQDGRCGCPEHHVSPLRELGLI